MTKRPEYIVIGKFGRPRGLSGEVYITPATDDPERFGELDEVYAVKGGEREKLRIEHAGIVSGRPVMKIVGYDTPEKASELTNRSIEIPINQARQLPEGSYYQFDLVGCRVRGADGTEYGVVEEILFYPANDIYRIYSDRYGEVLLPAVDRFIVSVDIDKKEIIIDPPPGLFEETDEAKKNA